jgi:uncharacterized membrane protein
MTKTRLEAFSDGVIAILITILVLELRVPRGGDWNALRPVLPVFLTYLLSFVFLGIYWNNHHHLLHATTRIRGAVLWANLHLMFWLSLVPFVTGWMGENLLAPAPTAVYGIVLFLCGVAFLILKETIIADRANSKLAEAMGGDMKGKLSATLYAVAIGMSFAVQWIACAIYVLVALIWLVPDRRIESKIS